MKYLVTLGLLSCVIISGQALPHCHLSELWSCAEIAIDWFHSLPKRSVPETEADLDTMCSEITKAVDCAFSYRDNCTTPLQRELIGLVIEGSIELYNDICSPGSNTRARYLAHSVCLNKVVKMDEFKEQIEYAMAWLENFKDMEMNKFITYACCGDMKVMNTLMKLVNDNCGKEAIHAGLDILSMSYAQLPEVLCGGFTGEEAECKEVLPPPGSKPSDNVKESHIYKLFQDIFKNWLD